jgi:hypothetical protein
LGELDPLTGPDPSTLTVALLAERLASERALREAHQKAVDKALEIQAKEYERRLEALNGEAGRLAKVLADSVPREVFTNYAKDAAEREQALVSSQTDRFNVAIEAINARVDELQNWRSGLEGRLIGVSAVIGVIVVVINIAIRVL